MGLGLGAVDLRLGRAYELRVVGLRAQGLGLGLRLGAVDLGLGRAYELRVPRVQSLRLSLGYDPPHKLEKASDFIEGFV